MTKSDFIQSVYKLNPSPAAWDNITELLKLNEYTSAQYEALLRVLRAAKRVNKKKPLTNLCK